MSAAAFSYAQAARGRTVSQPSQQETSSPAPSTTGSQGKDDASTGATSVTAPSVTSTSPDIRDTEQTAHTLVENGFSKQDPEAASVAGSNSSSASVAEQPDKTTEDTGAKSIDGQATSRSQSEDKASRSTSRTSRANDGAEGRKGRKGKKGRFNDKEAPTDQNQEEDAEKVKEPPKPVILTEAPLPTVNPWAKRMEAQKVVQVKGSDAPAADGESKPSPSSEEAGSRGTVSSGVNGDKWPQKKSTEALRLADQAPRRSGPRGSRAGDKDEKSSVALPPVADPTSWPDPKSAAEREQPARKAQEKIDTVVEKENLDEAGPTRKKTWEKLEIVHSVVFETQLPPLRGSKPRGGAARGGREAGSMRGSHPATAAAAAPQTTTGAVSDKVPSPGGSAGPKPTTTRPREGSIPSRGASLPKRASIDVASRDQRKPTVPSSTTEQARDTSLDASSSSKRASATRDIRLENDSLSSEGGQTAARAAPQDRQSYHARGEYTKDSQQYPRDGRPERGRGGFRARGGHNNSSHIPSASYPTNGHYPAPSSFQSRQNPNAHSPPPFSNQFPVSFGHSSRGRGNKWASSSQSAGRNGAGATGFPPKVAQANEFAVGQYPPYMYSPVFDASVPILKTQVEYYLSVENLCKDYYLRQHMDGQGFVHLATIAAFKRIKARTGTPYAKPDPQFATHFPVPMVPQPYPPAAVGGYPAFAEDQMYQPPFVNGAAYDPSVTNGALNGHHHSHETRLSAGVPEYAPPQSPVTLESMTNFPDSQVDNLMVVLDYDDKGNAGPAGPVSVAGYVSDSNQAATSHNVSGEAGTGSASAEAGQSERGIVWVDEQASAPTKEQRDRKPYTEIRKAALEQRQTAKASETPKEMQKLYKFWSQMLLNDFNAKVYEEFRGLAFEDALREAPSRHGLKSLLEFYDKLLLKTNTRKPWPQDRAVPEIFTAHMNEAMELDNKLSGKDAAMA
ncbi:hypothetical protein CHGG_02768 [Chaetomium globosum CBS 148.51]|uniref:HTH La-type RNA-binding domain-containing protein n=1 Tax=Chaetomium globosum (strain ATCC 6205 / CBS 148.51 / DSM 1962 / NBRC 6347 / NRRL 1970) TaxID=306901 RepID=Q2HAI6_CHAGB|nr:uncharacterized protein CHGG_02768 [Chaetomium globosum CBS 148.51]EAQ90833.1 hypothetical protein CHGG_02768 [Chaetomium globosum CBS 148.51]